MPRIRDPQTGLFVAHETYERRGGLNAKGIPYEVTLSARELRELRESDRQLELQLGRPTAPASQSQSAPLELPAFEGVPRYSADDEDDEESAGLDDRQEELDELEYDLDLEEYDSDEDPDEDSGEV